jgi:hypothetical protein
MPKRSDSTQLPFNTKYKRPKKFSNPYRHFSSKELSNILKKPDEELMWSDFNRIFHYGTPAGAYPEIVYFLPWTLKYLESHPYNLSEFFGGLTCFFANEEKRLRKDNLFLPCMDALSSAFKGWTSTFKVIHYDKEACRKKQWNLEYQDIVEHSEVISEFIDALCREEILLPLAIDRVKFLADESNEPVRSAWFLEYIYMVRKGYEYYSGESFQNQLEIMKESPGFGDKSAPPGFDMTPTKKIPGIFEIVSDSRLIKRHYLKIQDSIIKEEKSPTYWRDLIAFLKIE